MRQDKQIINKAIYLALGVALNGKKELLGMWLSENEGAKFWLGYTTNAIESLNSVIRTAVNKRKVFPSDQAAFKVVYLATQQASKKWSMPEPIRNWTSALNRFMIMFDDRISKHLI